jgi:preprotein translocase subunit YajC
MTLHLLFVFLLGTPSGEGGMGQYMNVVMIAAMVGVFYFFMIRPQAQKAKNQKTFIDSLAKGDRVVTVAGMHGRISRVNENGTLEVEIDNNVKVVMERSGISLDYTTAHQQSQNPPVKKS